MVSQALPQVLNKILTDKKFIANLAKSGVIACAEHLPSPSTALVLIEAMGAKSIDMQEFAT